MNQKNASHSSIEAECSVIGGLLLDNNAWEIIAEILTPDDFYSQSNKIIFQALEKLFQKSKPFDVLVLSEALNSSNELYKIGDESYLFKIVYATPSAANIKHYAEIVKEKSMRRRLLKIANEAIENSSKNLSVSELIEKTEKDIFNLSYSQTIKSKDTKNVMSIFPETLARIDKIAQSKTNITGLSTGFKELDDITSGLQPGELIIIAGRPSMGKTMISINIAENVAIADKEKVVLIFSLEMPEANLSERILSSLGNINHQNLRQGRIEEKDWSRMSFVVNKLRDKNLLINDQGALTPNELRLYAKKVYREYKRIDLIIVDYLQLMRVSGSNVSKVNEITEISRSLKALAKELNVPVIAISQLNREVEKRNNQRPVMSDLRDSGSLEQDADLLILLYRDEYYHPETLDKGQAEIIIAKQRNGPTDKIKLSFLGQFCKFENYSPIKSQFERNDKYGSDERYK